MGIRVEIGGVSLQAADYVVSEEGTPLAAGDATGGTGSITLTFSRPDEDVTRTAGRNFGWSRVLQFGEDILLGQDVKLWDNRKGYTVGVVVGASLSHGDAMLTITCRGRLQGLDAYNVNAAPFVGTLDAAFRYYCARAGISSDILVDPSIASRSVVFPGWTGELWYNLKRMVMAFDAEIALVSGIIYLRPIRTRVALAGRNTEKGRDVSTGQLAQSVEVYQYNNTAISNQPVYPPGGWTPEVPVFNVNAGETAEYTLDLSASLSSFVQPTMVTSVGPNDTSVYSIVANDGLPVNQSMWQGQGGKLELTLDKSTTKILLKLTGPSGPIPLATGGAATNFSVALASGTTTNRYSTLRINGTGVAFKKEKVTILTGVPAGQTGTEVGVTIDNPFLSTRSDVMRVGSRAAKLYAGAVPSLTGTVVSINARGDSGTETVTAYAGVQLVRNGKTYATVQTEVGVKSYQAETDQWNSGNVDSFENQAFGNVNGTRVWDEKSKRWYRIRSGDLSPEGITFAADDDMTYADYQTGYAGRTYASLQTLRNGLTYRQVDLIGLVQ